MIVDELEDETCNPNYTPPAPIPNLPPNSGSCDVVRVPIGPRGGIRKDVQDNCTKPGYKPHPIYGTTDRCECVPEATQLCPQEGSNCNQDPSTCQAQPGCNDYQCIGLVAGRTPGKCQNPANICSKENALCSIDANCQSGGAACSQYTCWTIGKGKQCRFGIQPTTTIKKVCKSKSDPGFDPNKHVDCALAGGISCGDANNPGFQTAIGCIHTNPVELVKDFLKFGLGIGGGLAFLMMLLGVFQMLTSAGNPETLAAGKDRLTNAVIGLLFVIFSVLLLQIIGFGILDIPGFGR
ncbi:MAG: pilin [Patescibacteria group bacterium]